MNRSFLFFALACCLLFSSLSHGQSLVNSTGVTVKDNGYTFEYSIGEISINTLMSTPAGNNYVTQGLLQPTLKFIDPPCAIINDTVQFFPNPTRNILSFASRYDWITSYRIYSTDGKLVRIANFTNNQIDLSTLASAVYFITLYPGCDNKYRVLKVIKQ